MGIIGPISLCHQSSYLPPGGLSLRIFETVISESMAYKVDKSLDQNSKFHSWKNLLIINHDYLPSSITHQSRQGLPLSTNSGAAM